MQPLQKRGLGLDSGLDLGLSAPWRRVALVAVSLALPPAWDVSQPVSGGMSSTTLRGRRLQRRIHKNCSHDDVRFWPRVRG